VRIIADTNLLTRLAVDDDPDHRRLAAKVVKEAETVIVGNVVLSEFVWVLRSRYGYSRTNVIEAIENLCSVENVVVDAAALESGLAAIRGGADFADGVIAYEGRWLGGEEFVSFDKKAVAAIASQGVKVRLLK
jgi:predicted nucleic-acid-binding protein